jgi:hypothetical protein
LYRVGKAITAITLTDPLSKNDFFSSVPEEVSERTRSEKCEAVEHSPFKHPSPLRIVRNGILPYPRGTGL